MSNSVFQSVIIQLKEISDRTFGVMDSEGCVVSCTDMSLLGERWADAALKVGNSAESVVTFAQGITLRDGTVCLPAKLEPLGAGESLVTVCEGKYHQVRRMMASRSMTVTYLERRQEGSLTLGSLPRGQVRELTETEVASLEG